MLQVQKITLPTELEKAFQIRHDVFVIGQNVPSEEEYDTYENVSTHYLATWSGTACGTARWRFTEKGIKLERFAVLERFRNKGVGAAILQLILQDLHNESQRAYVYMHAQVHAMPFYERFGFVKEGRLFHECDIPHFVMALDGQ